jgi:hypothetical protein
MCEVWWAGDKVWIRSLSSSKQLSLGLVIRTGRGSNKYAPQLNFGCSILVGIREERFGDLCFQLAVEQDHRLASRHLENRHTQHDEGLEGEGQHSRSSIQKSESAREALTQGTPHTFSQDRQRRANERVRGGRGWMAISQKVGFSHAHTHTHIHRHTVIL